jgi:hypothetical protein
MEARMPANFGEIARYHRQEAVRYQAQAQASRERGNLGEAEYLAGQAARHEEAAREQKIEMRQDPAAFNANPRPNRYSPERQPTPLAAARQPALRRCAARLVAAMRRFLPKRSAPFRGLSLR